MEEYAVWKEVMWPQQAGDVTNLFPVVEGREEDTFFPFLAPMYWGRGWLIYAPPQIRGTLLYRGTLPHIRPVEKMKVTLGRAERKVQRAQEPAVLECFLEKDALLQEGTGGR